MIETALELRDLLQATEHRIVLAESCTAGRIAATLGIIPGISQWFCGSFVIYRNDSKASWLGIPSELLDDPQIGPVSAEVTRRLAQEALGRTGEADVALSITGEIGPGVSADNDGLLYCAVQFREHKHNDCQQYRLRLPAPEKRGIMAQD